MAAAKLKTTVDQLEIQDGVVFIKSKKRKKVAYGELTKGQKIEKHLTEKPAFKDYSHLKISGKSLNRADGMIKVKGEAKYAGDIRLPGMVYARILRPPSHGCKLSKADTSEAEKLAGIQVVKDGDLIAVLHKNPELAQAAIQKIKAEYIFNEKKIDDKNLFQYLLNENPEARVNNNKGDITAGISQSSEIIESEFYNAYVAHSTMEPHAAVAMLEGDKLTAWVSTQTPFPAQESIARELEIPLDKVRVITPFLGGGFGGKSAHRQAVEAAKLAKITGKPVMVAWDRKEEFFYDTFRPAAIVKIKSGMDNQGNMKLWDYY